MQGRNVRYRACTEMLKDSNSNCRMLPYKTKGVSHSNVVMEHDAASCMSHELPVERPHMSKQGVEGEGEGWGPWGLPPQLECAYVCV